MTEGGKELNGKREREKGRGREVKVAKEQSSSLKVTDTEWCV